MLLLLLLLLLVVVAQPVVGGIFIWTRSPLVERHNAIPSLPYGCSRAIPVPSWEREAVVRRWERAAVPPHH